jgi:DNA primase
VTYFKGHPPLKVDALRNLIEGGAAPFKQTPRSYILWCPAPDCRRQKLYVEKQSGLCKCFRCGFGGWANWALARVYGRSAEELDEALYGIVSTGTIIAAGLVNITDFWGEEMAEDALLPAEPTYPPEIAKDPDWCDLDEEASAPARAYLESRGIDLMLAKAAGIGFHPGDQRVLFPVIVEGKLRGWQGRYIHKTDQVVDSGRVIRIPKIMTVGKLGKECFMFQDNLRGAYRAVLTEGPVDALKCHYAGAAVASMGKDVSTRQLDIIVRAGVKELLVGLDRDADKQVSFIVRSLYGAVKLFRLLPPPHRSDLGDCTYAEVIVQAQNAEEMGPAHIHQTYCPMPKLWS